MSNADIVRAGYAAIARGNFDAISDLLDPDVKWHAGDPHADYACQNREQALAWMRRGADGRGGATPELIDVVEAGDRVVVILQPQPTADDPAPDRAANLTTFRDGRVVEMVHYDDAAEALAALSPSADGA